MVDSHSGSPGGRFASADGNAVPAKWGVFLGPSAGRANHRSDPDYGRHIKGSAGNPPEQGTPVLVDGDRVFLGKQEGRRSHEATDGECYDKRRDAQPHVEDAAGEPGKEADRQGTKAGQVTVAWK